MVDYWLSLFNKIRDEISSPKKTFYYMDDVINSILDKVQGSKIPFGFTYSNLKTGPEVLNNPYTYLYYSKIKVYDSFENSNISNRDILEDITARVLSEADICPVKNFPKVKLSQERHYIIMDFYDLLNFIEAGGWSEWFEKRVEQYKSISSEEEQKNIFTDEYGEYDMIGGISKIETWSDVLEQILDKNIKDNMLLKCLHEDTIKELKKGFKWLNGIMEEIKNSWIKEIGEENVVRFNRMPRS